LYAQLKVTLDELTEVIHALTVYRVFAKFLLTLTLQIGVAVKSPEAKVIVYAACASLEPEAIQFPFCVTSEAKEKEASATIVAS
jgi:hypothetical protein